MGYREKRGADHGLENVGDGGRERERDYRQQETKTDDDEGGKGD